MVVNISELENKTMRYEDKIIEKFGKKSPYRAPEGYFEDFKKNLMTSLPSYPEKPTVKDLSVWQRIKPYVYLAAMFAGIWCMMQIFHRVSTASSVQKDTYAAAMYDPDSYDFYFYDSPGEDLIVQDDVVNLYPDMEELKRDFYAQL